MKAVNPSTRKWINRASLAVLAAYFLTFIHHIYGGLVDGASNRLLVPLIMAIPLLVTLGFLVHYRRTGSPLALTLFSIVAIFAWVILLGVLHGGYAHIYKDILFLVGGPSQLYYPLNPSEHYPPDDLFFEITGALDIVTAYFVILSAVRLLRDRRTSDHYMSDPEQALSAR